jgi:hypothetical protein
MSTDRLHYYVDHAERGAERNRLAVQRIERVLALRDNASAADGGISLSPSFAQLRTKTSEELRTMQAHAQAQLKRYEQALRTATAIVDERAQ